MTIYILLMTLNKALRDVTIVTRAYESDMELVRYRFYRPCKKINFVIVICCRRLQEA